MSQSSPPDEITLPRGWVHAAGHNFLPRNWSPRITSPFSTRHSVFSTASTTCQHPPSFFSSTYLPSPFHPRKESQCQCCALFPPPRSSLSLSRIVDISSSLFFSSPSFGRIMTENRRKMRRRESWRRERVFPTRGAESLESRAHGCPRKSLFFSSRRREMRARARGIRKGSIGSFFFFFFLIVSASEPERSTLLLGNSSSSVAEISINHYVIHPRLILDEEEL